MNNVYNATVELRDTGASMICMRHNSLHIIITGTSLENGIGNVLLTIYSNGKELYDCKVKTLALALKNMETFIYIYKMVSA